MAIQNALEIGRLLLSRLLPLIVGAVCLAPFAPLLTPSDAVVSGSDRDYAVMHLPLASFAREELLSGRLPLWNPYLACGQPLLAAQQAMLFYPLATPLCLLFGANGGLKAAIFVHLALCYTGTYYLARRSQLSAYAAAYAAFVVTWSGAMLGQIADGHLGAVFAAALAPWFFLALAGLLHSPSAASSAKLAAVGSCCSLVAQPQVFYYTLVAGGLWTVGSLISGAASRHRWRTACWGVVAALVAILIAAVQILPALELVRDGMAYSERGTQYFSGHFALDGRDGPRLLMPYLNGTPFAGIAPYDRSDQYHERVVYLGLAVPLLAIYGLSRASAARWQWAAACGILVALAIAFGNSTPAFTLLGKALPGLMLFRCPGRVFLIASVPAALLAGRGLDTLAQGERRASWGRLSQLVILLMVALDIPAYAALDRAASFDWQNYIRYARQTLPSELSLWAMLAVGTLLIAGMAMVGRLRGLSAALALSAVTAVDLGHFNVGNFYLAAPETRRRAPPPSTDGAGRFIEGVGVGRAADISLRYSRLTSEAIYERWPTVSTYDGGVLPAATARLYASMRSNARPPLALAACRFACSTNGRTIEHSDGVLPRIRFLREGNPSVELPIESVTDHDVRSLRQSAIRVSLLKEAPGELQTALNAAARGSLIVADTYYPGWVCRVDGELLPIERAHGVFRRVRLEAGHHTLVMSYTPLSFRIGLIGTIVGVLIAVSMGLVRCTNPRRRRTATIIERDGRRAFRAAQASQSNTPG
ncbi:MAG TPA: YfhO family protein [Pirellulales bacterium]|nr:YfhO family protein [Pirellulales bacterium]